MKKRISKSSSIIIMSILFSYSPVALSDNAFFTSSEETGALADDPETEGVVLKGDVIESCQEIAKTGWGGKLSKESFNPFIRRELKKARRRMNESLSDLSGSQQVWEGCFKNGSPTTPCNPEAGKASVSKDDFDKFKDQTYNSYATYSSKVTKSLDKVRKCLSLYTVIKGASSKREMQISEDNKSATASSFDGKLQCSSQGYETQDFKGCKDSVMYYDGVFLGRKAVEVAQQFDYMDSSMDVQSDLAKNAQTDATAGLKAQRSDIKKRAEMARTRAATETAAVIALWTSMEKIPSIDDLTQECTDRSKSYLEIFASAHEVAKKHHSQILAQVKRIKELTINVPKTDAQEAQILTGQGTALASLEENKNHYVSSEPDEVYRSEDACNSYVYDQENGATHAMINNSHAKEVIQQALIDAGVNVATMLGTAEILDKQAGRVSDAIKLVDGHNPETLEYGGEDVLTTECQLNPGSSACANINRNDAVDYYNQGINVDGIQFATSDSTSQELDEFGNRDVDSSGDTTRNGSPTGISAIAGADKGSGLAEGPAAAASVKSSGGNGIGSGLGGGGGGGGGGGSAPANGSAQTGGPGEKKAFVGSAKNMKFSGGGGALRFGSSSSKRKTKEKAKNPFANLFKKGGKKKDGVLNFRGVASVGKKKGSIFKMISNRYSIVNKEKRLLTYELEKVNGDLP
ncbi:hypothetical protein [Halobacteriovorax sp. HLS]|uniref:hypothetical protein n=1 Tax=Halobacteriovorax sp. HLS TaxID=2234000 RepID=UPI000FD90651|nr:hypothetical protein [Halobacteriovorax sp. HLS]